MITRVRTQSRGGAVTVAAAIYRKRVLSLANLTFVLNRIFYRGLGVREKLRNGDGQNIPIDVLLSVERLLNYAQVLMSQQGADAGKRAAHQVR